MIEDKVSFDDFKKLDIRIGKVVSVDNHPNADKLYILKIDIGGDIKQCVAGLKQYLRPEQILNKSLAVIVNLQPAVLRGVESQVMLLAASTESTTGRDVVLVVPEKELPPGSRVS
ncbi:MAG: hypothetical protein QME51_05890 [Planctomycetota bacterium]|nr:hypothetical protein [Planctomycetota bacterium]MDI6787883.1 hypothetical protein [Planctomycetota bacterium]